MPGALPTAIAALCVDPNIGHDAVYIADGGVPRLVHVILRRPDDVTGFGDTRIRSETSRVELREAGTGLKTA